ncbi:hypothetical protein WJX73_005934 [Symbiochloris irregularis]|uniref:plastoquinol--plastocyanin reductase n=1 Tax=Symbiochloris irregularis TaxID=706552 RepID=A0AAW1NUI7_9CHLO
MALLAGTSQQCLGRQGCLKTCAPSAAVLRSAPRRGRKAQLVTSASAAAGAEVPSPEKRVIMNWLLVGAAALPVTGLAVPYIAFFVPPSTGGGGDSIAAKDAAGNDVVATKWLKEHRAGDRSLTQGLKSDATYLIVNDKSEIEKFGLNAVCTHLGCVVPWNTNENKFKCPCHGSQYNAQGKVVRGPAPLSLALAHADIKDDVVFFSPWKETDFRTGQNPWWT